LNLSARSIAAASLDPGSGPEAERRGRLFHLNPLAVAVEAQPLTEIEKVDVDGPGSSVLVRLESPAEGDVPAVEGFQ
jgi:hypothetical protein